MKPVKWWMPWLALLVLVVLVPTVVAQEKAPLMLIQGAPDAASSPPDVQTYVSVINPDTATSIEGLTAANFNLSESDTAVSGVQVSYETVGLAVVIVVDRGGISAAGDPRIKQATALANALVDRLSVTNVSSDDIVAMVGVGEKGVLQPEENFTLPPSVDTNRVRNALLMMEGETVKGGTPLYDGLDEALRLLIENPDKDIRESLSHRRKVIVVFSDGIDKEYSDEAREFDIIKKANDHGISLYAIGMARTNQALTGERNLVRLTGQTKGLYLLRKNADSEAEVKALFDRLVTQRQQYLLRYTTHQRKGTFLLKVVVNTPDLGSAEQTASFASVLEVPEVAIVQPTTGMTFTVPFSQTTRGPEPFAIALRAQVTFPDDVTKNRVTEVRYFANGNLIGSGTASPDFAFDWPVSTLVTPTTEAVVQQYTLTAEGVDALTGQALKTGAPVKIEVTWEWEEPPVPERLLSWARTNWFLLLALVVLGIGMIVLLILLISTRGKIATQAVKATTGVLKGMTQRLGAQPPAPGKLVVVQGANMGREFRLTGPVVKVGRDPQFSDFALYDEFVSNPHFTITMDQTQFFITDEGSTNGTRVNGVPIPPRQRMLLQAEAIIEVGQTRLQFKRLGGTTRALGAGESLPPATPLPYPPTQVAPPGQDQVPPVKGGPTRRV